MKNIIYGTLLIFGLVACGEGTVLKPEGRDFFSQDNPFQPLLSVLGDNPMVIERGTRFQDPGARAESLREGDLSSNIETEGSVNTDEVGEYRILYRVADSQGRTTSGARLVIVVDTSAPNLVISSIGPSPSNSVQERIVSFSGDRVSHYKAVVLNAATCAGVDFDDVDEREVSQDFSFIPDQGENVVCAVGRNLEGNYQTQPSQSAVLFVDSIAPVVEIALAAGTSYDLSPRMISIFDSTEDAVEYKAVSLLSSNCSSASFAGVDSRPITEAFTFEVQLGVNIICAIGIDALGNTQAVPTASAVLEIQSTAILVALNESSPTRVTNLSATFSGPGVDFYKAVHRTGNNCNAVNFQSVDEHPVAESFSFTAAEGDNIVCAIGRNVDGAYSGNPADVGTAYIFVDSILPELIINRAGLGASPSNNLDPRSLVIQAVQADVTHYKARAYDNRTNCQGVDLSGASAQSIGTAFEFIPQASDPGVGNRNYIVCAIGTDSIGYNGPVASSGDPLVIDTTPPVISLNGDSQLNLPLCQAYEELGADIEDRRDGNLIDLGAASVMGTVDHLTPDTYLVEYNAEDEAGNAAETVTRTVEVDGSVRGTNFQKAINSRQGLSDIANELSWNYLLCSDLDLSDQDFQPIGGASGGFSGIFEADEKNIIGLRVSGNQMNQGLFRVLEASAQIRNLSFQDVDVVGRERVGALAGINLGLIENVHVLSGVVGGADSGSPKKSIGGLVGQNLGSIEMSSADVSVSGDEMVGGLVGFNKAEATTSGRIRQSFAKGNLSGDGDVSIAFGGLVGRNEGLIQDSYAHGSVQAGTRVGGLVGENEMGSDSTPQILRSYALGSNGVSGSSDVGGLVGFNDVLASVSASYWNYEISGIGDPVLPPSAGEYGEMLSDEAMKMLSSYDVSWDFDQVWDIEESVSYPFLVWEP